MIEYDIVTQKYADNIDLKLVCLDKQRKLESGGIEKLERADHYCYRWKGNKKEQQDALEYMANIISDIVQEKVIAKFAKDYLCKHPELEQEERLALRELFILNNYIAKEDGVSYISYYVVYIPILKELEKEHKINIDGWIEFRTQKYKVILKDVLEQTIYDYKTQKEYLECISVLLESRRLQEMVEEILHLVPGTNGKMQILNSDRKEMTAEYIQKYCQDLIGEGDVTEEDLLMNIFISVSPRTIYIHQKKKFDKPQFIETLEVIFEGQIKYCVGCKDCQ